MGIVVGVWMGWIGERERKELVRRGMVWSEVMNEEKEMGNPLAGIFSLRTFEEDKSRIPPGWRKW